MQFSKMLQQCDSYRSVEPDLTKRSSIGGFFSILAGFMITILCWTEIRDYLNPDLASSLVVEHHQDMYMKLELDIDLYRIPCGLVMLEMRDQHSTHNTDKHRSLIWQRTRKQGTETVNTTSQEFGKAKWSDRHTHHIEKMEVNEYNEVWSHEQLRRQLTKGEGCRIYGKMLVKRAAGKLRFTSSYMSEVIRKVYLGTETEKYDFSHAVNAIEFSPSSPEQMAWTDPMYTAMEKMPEEFDNIKPEEIEEVMFDHTDANNRQSFVYDFQLVSTRSADGKRGYTYTAADHTYVSPPRMNKLPTMTFLYEVSPVSIHYSEHSKSFLHLTTHLTALIGGIYTLGLILSGMFCATAYVYKQKLG